MWYSQARPLRITINRLHGLIVSITFQNHLANRGIVHRDLAARNILMDRNKHLKVADFGLSRTGVYVTHRGGRIPLRWLSIEAIRDNLYSTQSDIWAFGVVLWEICTLGKSSILSQDLWSGPHTKRERGGGVTIHWGPGLPTRRRRGRTLLGRGSEVVDFTGTQKSCVRACL